MLEVVVVVASTCGWRIVGGGEKIVVDSGCFWFRWCVAGVAPNGVLQVRMSVVALSGGNIGMGNGLRWS